MKLEEALDIGQHTLGELRLQQDEEIDTAKGYLSAALGEELYDDICPDWEGVTEWFPRSGELSKLVLKIEETARLGKFWLVYIRTTANLKEFRLLITSEDGMTGQHLDGLKCVDITNSMDAIGTRDRVCAFLHSISRGE